ARAPVRPKAARPPAVAVITTTAGGATTVVDPLATRGVAIAQPSAETYSRFAAAGIAVARARVVDLTIAGTRYEVMKGALDILLSAPEFDLVVAVVGSSARFHPELAVKPIIDSAGANKPIAAYLTPEAPQALAAPAAAGVPGFHTPEACADAIAAALRRRTPVDMTSRPQSVDARDKPGHDGGRDSGRLLDELAAYKLIERLGIRCAPAIALDS